LLLGYHYCRARSVGLLLLLLMLLLLVVVMLVFL